MASTVKTDPEEHNREDEENAPAADDEDTGAQVAAIVKLEEVVVNTGEEDEDPMLDLKAKLYRFDKEGNQWKERGVGNVKLLKHKVSGTVRLVMRQSKTLKICANHLVLPTMSVQAHAGNDKSCVWHATDFADGELKEEMFCIRFASVESMDRVRQAMTAQAVEKAAVEKAARQEKAKGKRKAPETAVPPPAPPSKKTIASRETVTIRERTSIPQVTSLIPTPAAPAERLPPVDATRVSTSGSASRGSARPATEGDHPDSILTSMKSSLRWFHESINQPDVDVLEKKTIANNLNQSMILMAELMHVQATLYAQVRDFRDSYNEVGAENEKLIAEKKNMAVKLDDEKAKVASLETALKTSEDQLAESREAYKKRDEELVAAVARASDLEAQLVAERTRRKEEAKRVEEMLKKREEEIFDHMFIQVDEFRRSALYGAQLLCGPLDLRKIDLSKVVLPQEGFDIFRPSAEQIKEGRARDATLIGAEVEETEAGQEAGDEVEQPFPTVERVPSQP